MRSGCRAVDDFCGEILQWVWSIDEVTIKDPDSLYSPKDRVIDEVMIDL